MRISRSNVRAALHFCPRSGSLTIAQAGKRCQRNPRASSVSLSEQTFFQRMPESWKMAEKHGFRRIPAESRGRAERKTDRKSDVKGKSVSVRVALGVSRIIKKKIQGTEDSE